MSFEQPNNFERGHNLGAEICVSMPPGSFFNIILWDQIFIKQTFSGEKIQILLSKRHKYVKSYSSKTYKVKKSISELQLKSRKESDCKT